MSGRLRPGFPVLNAAAAVGLTGWGALAYAVRGRSAQIFGRSVYRGAPGRRSVALTFDDGPSEGTAELLAYLAGEGVRATFFQCGMNAERSPAAARQVSEAGHEIGNHTYSHMRLCPRVGWQMQVRSSGEIRAEVARTQEILAEIHGSRPRLFRAPYGMRWFGLDAVQRELGLLGVMWTTIGHDWEWPAERIAGYVLRRMEPGAIVCLHDGRDIQQTPDISEMLKALRVLVPALKERGYRFETVSEILVAESGQGR